MSRKKTHNKTNIILNRISAHYHLTNDDDIASFYGVSKSTVSSWRTRDSINETLIKAKCSDDNLANWFINGIKTQNQKSGIGEDAGDYNAGQQSPYPDPVRISDPLIQKTAAILESPTIFSTALKSNIEAFHYALVCEEKLDLANKRIDDLEEWKKSVEKRLPSAVNGS